MALMLGHTAAGQTRHDWERSVQLNGLCEVSKEGQKADTAHTFREWAKQHGYVCVDGEALVAMDPKRFDPRDSLDRGKFGFLARYFRPRETFVFLRDLEHAFGVRSVPARNAIKSYWASQGIIQGAGPEVQADRNLLRLMGFTYLELMDALDGVVKKTYLQEIPNGHKLVDPALCYEYAHYLVNFDIMKERFFDSAFLLQQAGQPLPLSELGRVMGVDDMEDLRKILREAKKRYDLNIEVSDAHVMFGPPTESSIQGLITKERNTKTRLSETENQLRGRLKTIKELSDRYGTREAKILNEIESLKDEGRLVYVKSKVVDAVQKHIDGANAKVSR